MAFKFNPFTGTLDNIGPSSGTVEDYGARGDGTTDDSAAFIAMLNATGGKLKLLAKEYKVNQLVLTSYNRVEIIGTTVPLPNTGRTQLVNGSVIIGGIYIEANDVYMENFGLDFGSGRSVTYTDGLVLNAKPSQVGNIAYINNVSSLGAGGVGLTHGVLAQGYNQNTIRNVFSAKHGYGVVLKGRQGLISDIRTESTIQVGLFVKGDAGVSAGNVANGKALEISINNVISIFENSNITGNGVWVQAPTDDAGKVLINNVYQLRGKAPVFVSSAGSVAGPFANIVSISNIMSEYAQYGLLIGGITNTLNINNVTTVNPLTGLAVTMDNFTTGYNLNNINVYVNDATITAVPCLQLYGIGAFDNVTVQNSFRQMRIAVAGGSLGSIKTGNISGDCFIENEGNLTGINGAELDPTDPARLTVLPRSVLKLSGRFDLTSSSNKFICNLPITTGKQYIFACGGIDATDNYTTIAVRLNSFQLSVEPSLPTGFKSVDLTGITITL